MITVAPGQNIPTAQHSKTKLEFVCECGNKFTTMWASFTSGKAKSCGKCKIFKWKTSGQTVFGRLTLSENLDAIQRLVDPVWWLCSCGTKKKIKPVHVMSGATVSCGCVRRESISKSRQNPTKIVIKSKSEWLESIHSLIDTGSLPDEWSRGSSSVFTFKCSCGRTYERKFNKFTDKSTCGQCTRTLLVNGSIINGFTYIGENVEINSNSNAELLFKCRCERETRKSVRDVFSGQKSTCGWCNVITAQELSVKSFGRLRLEEPQDIHRFSEKRLAWICSCGNRTSPSFHSVISGKTRSCGNCKGVVDEWWVSNKEALANLTYPIEQDNSLIQIFNPEEQVLGPRIPFIGHCPICGDPHRMVMDQVRIGESLTCGCSSNKSSLAQRDVAESLRRLGIEVELEFKVGGLHYDIAVPKSKLVVEYHGLKWHATEESRLRDARKFKNAIESGWQFVSIFEDEWREKSERVVNLLVNRIGSQNSSVKLRPSECEIRIINSKIADEFLSAHHYIGACKPYISYGALYHGEVIGCMSFKTPTRQSKHPWELVRMASDRRFRIHGIWSKLLKQFVSDRNPVSIVSFSDNRLFSGSVYQKMGFHYDGDVNPDYYWCKGKKRFHKSGLRKKPNEKDSGLTETQLRTAQGYQKIWDLGKKRWVWLSQNLTQK